MAHAATTINSMSTTPASNGPAGTDNIGTNLDLQFQNIQAALRKQFSAGTIASATTTDLSSVSEGVLTVTGTTTITGLGTLTAGIQRVLVFADALTFTHNGTSLILPGGASITTAAGDVAIMTSLGSGNWRCLAYTRSAGMYATLAGVETFTNKTLTSPVLTTPQINDTSADHQYIVAVSELAADRTVTLPLLTGDDEVVFKDHAQSLTNKTITGLICDGLIREETSAVSDGAAVTLDPADGTVQTWTLGANRVAAGESLADGDWIELFIDDGTAYTLDLDTNVVDQWIGGAAPALPTSGYAHIIIRKIGTTVYASSVGDYS